jgi:hypothetical protein
MNSKTQELFEAIGEKLIKAIEGGETGTWSKPWQTVLSGQAAPVNASTQKPYQGINSEAPRSRSPTGDSRRPLSTFLPALLTTPSSRFESRSPT